MVDARLGIDVGGTFTDFVVFDPGTGSFSIGKTLTTPHDPGPRNHTRDP